MLSGGKIAGGNPKNGLDGYKRRKINNKYIKSPLNYVGGKYKLLDQIIPIFPDKINTFVDLFGGGFNVGININANKIQYNDLETHVCELLEYFYHNDTSCLLSEINKVIELYGLSKTNKEGFLNLRNCYNQNNQNPILFYCLIVYAFNYQIRFNKKGEYNMPFGKDRSSFNPALEKHFIEFVNALHTKEIEFFNTNFTDFDFSELNENDLVYCDPPYLNSVAAYNEQDGWNEKMRKIYFSC